MSTARCHGGRRRCAVRCLTAVLFLFVGMSAASAQPDVPSGLVKLFEYQFESDHIRTDIEGTQYVINTLSQDGWPYAYFVDEPLFVEEDGNGSLLFDGVNDHLEIRRTSDITFHKGLYAQAKVKVNDTVGNRPGSIVAKWYGGDQWLLQVIQGVGTGPYGMLDFTVRLDDGTTGGTDYRIVYFFASPSYIGRWITVTGVYDPARGIELYVDGALVASNKNTNGWRIVDGPQPIRIGEGGPDDGVAFKGQIDDVVVWGDFAPALFGGTPLVQYNFDSGEVDLDQREVANLVAEQADWMRGRTVHKPVLTGGASGLPDDRALKLNLPWKFLNPDFVEVNHGEYLTFRQGLRFEAKIYLDPNRTKRYYEIANHIRLSEESITSNWGLSIATWVLGGDRFSLDFQLQFEDGREGFLYYELPTSSPLFGRWIDVAAVYYPAIGLARLAWDGQWVATKEFGPGIIRGGTDPIWIGRGAALWTVFRGQIDEVKISGDRPNCYELTTEVEPTWAGNVYAEPQASETDFCTGDAEYAVGERVDLEAEKSSSESAFYEWLEELEYLDGSEKHMNTVTVTLLGDTTATAYFVTGDYPAMTRFPVAGRHNTGIDSTCSNVRCALGCDDKAKALANSDCIGGHRGLDIFGRKGTRIVAAQSGYVDFTCDFDPESQELIGGNAAYVYVLNCDPDNAEDRQNGCCIPGKDPNCPKSRVVKYAYYYAHLDGLCSSKGTNLCDERIKDVCPDCSTHEPEQETFCREKFEDGDFVNAGDKLGELGKSGNAWGTVHHLHYGIYEPENNWRSSCVDLNPFPFLYVLEEDSCPDWRWKWPPE